MQRILLIVISFLMSFSVAWADGLVPVKRFVVTDNMDFYGGDLQPQFDTNLSACERACRADDRCVAFTFNRRTNACFPKTSIEERKPYEGAISAEALATDAAVLKGAAARRERLDFLDPLDFKNAHDQALKIGSLHPASSWTAEEMMKAATDRESAKDLLNAMRWTGAAISRVDSSRLWAEYARRSLEIPAKRNSEKRKYARRALDASINAYLRALTPEDEVRALQVLAQGLEANRRGQEAVPTLRLATSLSDDAGLAKALDRVIGKYGFRVVKHEVESNAASPRLCAHFSESLVRHGVDYANFVRLPNETLVVQAEGSRICVDGVQRGERYQIRLRKGLPALSGEVLHKDVDLTMYVRDRAPMVRFSGRSYVLPRGEGAALPVQSVNLSEADLVLRQVSERNLIRAIDGNYFARPLAYYQSRRFNSSLAEEIWRGTARLQNRLNEEMTTRLPMGDVLKGRAPGIYVLNAEIPGADPYDDPAAAQWFVLTDLGLSSMQGTDGLHVFVRGLADAAPVEGVQVSLVAKSNRVLGSATSDASGYAHFPAALTRGQGSAAPALVVAETDADMSFLSLTGPAFDLSDRGVEGNAPAPAVDVFLATDRGAYRPGETVHATVLVRDAQARALENMPVTAILQRPNGVEYARELLNDGMAGGYALGLPLGRGVPTGSWRLSIHGDPDAPALASETLLVEDFLPERIDFDLSLVEPVLRVGDTARLNIAARYLFGAPAGNLPIEGEVTVKRAQGYAAYPGYRFGRHDDGFSPRSRRVAAPDGGPKRTEPNGEAQVDLPLAAGGAGGVPLEAHFAVRLSEGSGRPVERRLSKVLAPDQNMIGIKPLFDGVAAENTEAAFELKAINRDMQPTDMPVVWRLNRVRQSYQWYQVDGRWNWNVNRTRTRVASGEIALAAGEAAQISAPVEWGTYELVVEGKSGDYTASSVEFWAGWYAPADTQSSPDTLEISLDKPAYQSGETATLRVVPRYAGKGLITVMANRLIQMKTVDLVAGENLITLDVTDEWGSGVYVGAQVLRPMDVSAGLNPARALGLSHAAVDPGAKALDVALKLPAMSEPRKSLEAELQIEGLGAGDTAYATIAAVDLGILNLTGFKSPDPQDHYFGQRRLGMELRDLYGSLINGMDGAMGELRSGGDAARARPGLESPPPTERLVALFEGVVKLDDEGKARVSFDIPEFNGTVRVMAVAWTGQGVGQASGDVLVRDPVVLTASLPRVMAPGDESRLLLEFVHASGPAGAVELEVLTGSGVALEGSAVPEAITLEENGRVDLAVPLTAERIGDHELRVAITTPDGTRLEKPLLLAVRDSNPEIASTRRLSLAPGQSFALDREIFAGLRAGSGRVLLTAGPLARFDAAGLLNTLDRYPYGCTEQITSRAMPLLYLSDVAKEMQNGSDAIIERRVAEAIDLVVSRQQSNGGFDLWPGSGSGDLWLDAYVADFLSRAKAAGHSVPPRALRVALDNLRNAVNYAPDFEAGDYQGGDVAYALMVLAREGAAMIGDLRYFADEKSEDFPTPLAAAQLGRALAYYGDQPRADRMFSLAARQIAATPSAPEAPVWRADYGTRLRDAAGVLALAVAAGSEAVDREALVQRISQAERSLSTQEANWTLLAAHALVQDPSLSGLEFNGAPVSGPLVRRLDESALQAPLDITNTSTHPTDVTLTTFGKPSGAVEKSGYGITIVRRYYTLDGEEVIAGDDVAQGTRLVVVLTVTPLKVKDARLIVDDPLPGGFEIDNPNLLRAGDVRALDWLKLSHARYSEFRSDRFIAALDLRGGRRSQLAYIVRAVSPGVFHHPAAVVEDMYRPQYRAHTASGSVRITE